MNTYDFLLALGFWQWIGVLFLASLLVAGSGDIVKAVINAIRRKG